MSKPKRYQFHVYDFSGLNEHRIQPPPETDDIDEALAATATMPVEIWDTQYERYIAPVRDDVEYGELLYRLNAKRRGKIQPRWGNIAFALLIVGILAYCGYVLVTSPEPFIS